MSRGNVSSNQEKFLNVVRKEKIPTTIYMVSGFVYSNAIITSFDNYSVTFNARPKGKDGEPQPDVRQFLAYKHAISTFSPSRPVDLTNPADSKKEE